MQPIYFSNTQIENFTKNTKRNNKSINIFLLILVCVYVFILFPIGVLFTFLQLDNIIAIFVFWTIIFFVFFVFLIYIIYIKYKNNKKIKYLKNKQYNAYQVVCINKQESTTSDYSDDMHTSTTNYYIYTKLNENILEFNKLRKEYESINIGDNFIIIKYPNEKQFYSYLWKEFMV